MKEYLKNPIVAGAIGFIAGAIVLGVFRKYAPNSVPGVATVKELVS